MTRDPDEVSDMLVIGHAAISHGCTREPRNDSPLSSDSSKKMSRWVSAVAERYRTYNLFPGPANRLSPQHPHAPVVSPPASGSPQTVAPSAPARPSHTVR